MVPSKTLVVTSFMNGVTSTIDFDDFFCGHIPPIVAALCLKYLEMNNAFHIESDQLLSLKQPEPTTHPTSNTVDFAGTEHPSSVDYVSSAFEVDTVQGLSFRLHVNVNTEHCRFEMNCVLELVTLPDAVENITVIWDLRAKRAETEWCDINTMHIGDVVGPPPAILDAPRCASVPLLFQCDVDVKLVNGVPLRKQRKSIYR